MACGSNKSIMFDKPIIRFCIYSFISFFTFVFSSFSSMIVNSSFPSISSSSFNIFLMFCLNLFIEQYVSKHPYLPQLHCFPCFSIIICPISNPVFFLGTNNLLSRKTPAPIPVPKHKNTAS